MEEGDLHAWQPLQQEDEELSRRRQQEEAPAKKGREEELREQGGKGANAKHTALDSRVAISAGRNTLTVLYSDPLVHDETGSNPRTFAKLDVHAERAILKQCFKDASRDDIKLFFDSATYDGLVEAKTLRPSINYLHYSGHGHETQLPFENRKGGPDWLDSRVLEDLIAIDEGQPLDFVFVSACHSREAGEVFVEAGVKHVVYCEQESGIIDSAARDFSRQFYLALAAGHTVKFSFQQGCRMRRAARETRNFVLLPEHENHDVSIFGANEVREWRFPAELKMLNMIQMELPCRSSQPFVGREIDMYRVLNLILTTQLVSVVGEKGVGRRSLVNAVCHYINERRSTMLQTIGSIFFARAAPKTGSNRFLRVLQDWEKRLMSAESGAVHDVSNDMDSLVISICRMIRENALLVIDGTEYVKGSGEQQHLVTFFRSLQELRSTKVVVIGLEPLRNLFPPVEDYWLMPLDFYNTIHLFCNLCPRWDTPAERKVYRARLVTAVGEWSDQGDAARME